jgi:hypothetical protein
VQPFQDVYNQYQQYLQDGFDENFFRKYQPTRPNFGIWLTCFVAFNMNHSQTIDFLNLWYLQTLKYTTQDQLGFPYCCQKLNMIPYTLPDNNVKGVRMSERTDFYIKRPHGI